MSPRRSYVEENTRERERLRTLVERLSDVELRRPVNDYWTVAAVLGHIAFWDARALVLAEKLERWLPHIGHIQIAGVPGRHEPDNGEINYRYLFSRLDELGYDGWVGCEYRPASGTLEGLKWMTALRGR